MSFARRVLSAALVLVLVPACGELKQYQYGNTLEVEVTSSVEGPEVEVVARPVRSTVVLTNTRLNECRWTGVGVRSCHIEWQEDGAHPSVYVDVLVNGGRSLCEEIAAGRTVPGVSLRILEWHGRPLYLGLDAYPGPNAARRSDGRCWFQY